MENRVPKTPTSQSKPFAAGRRSSQPSHDDFVREVDTFLGRHQHVVPTAVMAGPSTAIPSRFRQSRLWDTGPPTPKSKGKERANDTFVPGFPGRRVRFKQSQDYQADADEVERARDEADPDFFAPPTPETDSKKRKRTSDQTPTAPSPENLKASRHKHQSYAKCKPETQQERDEHIRRIEENWSADASQWMSKGLMPSRRTKVGKGRGVLTALEPKDWNTNLLAELAYLSSMTRQEPAKAHKALLEAVERKDRLGRGPQVLQTDVGHAIKRCKQDDVQRDPDKITERSPSPMLSTPTPHPKVGQKPRRNDEAIQAAGPETSPIPSPTIVHNEAPIKQEATALPLRISEPPPNGLDEWDYDSEMEKLKEFELRMQATAAESDAKNAALAHHLQKRKIQHRSRMRERGVRPEDAINV